jgi:Arc/MetJ-type ribon-helix-helix transcriptional regulator
VKLSVSLPEADVVFVDEYSERTATVSRSAVIHKAIELLRESLLEDDYGAAWQEWEASEDADLWSRASSDGLTDASR